MPVNTGSLVIDSEIAFGADLVFVATDSTGAESLWITDGTAAGTKKLNVGNSTSGINTAQLSNLSDLTVIGSTLYFTANFGSFGPQVWSSHGVVGDLSQRASYSSGNQVGATIAYNGSLFFTDDIPTSTTGQGVYSTDGTNTFYYGDMTVNSAPVILNGDLFFAGYTSELGAGLYLTNASTVNPPIVTITSQPLPTGMVVSGSKAFFSWASSSLINPVLWVSDGTTAGTMVEPGSFIVSPGNITPFSGGVVLTGTGGTHAAQVWFSNGTSGGTYELYINQALDHSPSLIVGTEAPYQFVGSVASYAGKVFFVGGGELYSTDGTTAGTTAIVNLTGPSSNPTLMVFNNKLFAFGYNGSVVVSDGTAANTTVLTTTLELNGQPQAIGGKLYFMGDFAVMGTDGTAAGTTSIFSHEVGSLGSAGGLLYFAYDNGSTGQDGLYAYNPSTQTSTLLDTVNPENSVGSGGGLGLAVGSKLVFAGTDFVHGEQLWVSDGTVAGTQSINLDSQIVGQVRAIDPGDLTLVNGAAYFVSLSVDGSQSPALPGLWVSDGTAAGTKMVSNPDGMNVGDVTADGTLVLFQTNLNSFTPNLYSYNTVGGATTLIGQTTPVAPIVAGGIVYFTAYDSNNVAELARANAGGGETLLSTPANGEPYFLSTSYFTAVGSKLFYVGSDSVHGEGLFVSDGTVAGTTFLTSMPANYGNWMFSAIGSSLYFENSDAVNGSELWVSDGTVAGTHRVTDTTAAQSANASHFTVAGSRVYFSATDGVHGQELWSFNGSPGGQAMVADVNPGAAGSNPTGLTAIGSTLYFAGTAGDGSSELWSTTGSGVTELTSTANGASPADLTAVGSKLFFFGSDSAHGPGLFVTSGTALSTTFLDGFVQANSFAAVGSELYFNGDTSEGWGLWKSDGTVAGTLQLTSANANPADLSDFTGDGKSDILAESGAGAVYVGQVAGGAASFSLISGLGSDWSFHGDGFFYGDGKADFLIENAGGALDLGKDVSGQASFAQIGALGPEWAFKGTGDFLLHGDDQFLMENTAGAVVVGEVVSGQASYTTVGALGPEWTFEGTGGFLGDGKSGFLIENTAGAVAVGEVVNGHAAYTQVAALGPEWTFEETGNFLGDGKFDFLIENSGGAVAIGEVGANNQTSYTTIAALGPEWSFKGVGDYLGEGHDQFLIENTAGALVIGDWLNGQIHYTNVGTVSADWAFH